MHTRLVLSLGSLVLCFACAHHSGLSRQVAESVHRDYPACDGHHMSGHPIDEAAGTWSVDACGTPVRYQCPTGPNSRWHSCEQVGPTSGGVVVVQPTQ